MITFNMNSQAVFHYRSIVVYVTVGPTKQNNWTACVLVLVIKEKFVKIPGTCSQQSQKNRNSKAERSLLVNILIYTVLCKVLDAHVHTIEFQYFGGQS